LFNIKINILRRTVSKISKDWTALFLKDSVRTAQKTLRISYKNEKRPGWRNNRCLFSDPYTTREYAVWGERKIWNVSAGGTW